MCEMCFFFTAQCQIVTHFNILKAKWENYCDAELMQHGKYLTQKKEQLLNNMFLINVIALIWTMQQHWIVVRVRFILFYCSFLIPNFAMNVHTNIRVVRGCYRFQLHKYSLSFPLSLWNAFTMWKLNSFSPAYIKYTAK